MKATDSFATVYRVPGIISTITIAGLLFALFGDGPWDAISWLLLVLPLLVIAFFLL
jgi:hypothetical protein